MLEARQQEGEDEADAVWRALSNPVRRFLLDQLVEGPLTTGALVATQPRLSRFAVMQHLDVLVTAGLVLVRREGRKRLNYLNAVPVQEVCERWVSGLAGSTARAATAFRRHVENEPTTEPTTEPTNEMEKEQ